MHPFQNVKAKVILYDVFTETWICSGEWRVESLTSSNFNLASLSSSNSIQENGP
jgi:hypothetical protein